MIVGDAVAKVSNGAGSCTFNTDCYEAHFSDKVFRIFDTAGLNEGDHGRVPHWTAIRELYTLIRKLDGVSLLIFCLRGRIRDSTRANWILFNKIICGEQVPIVAAVTGLEEETNLDDWWRRERNKETFQRHQINPADVGCLVAVRGDQNQYEVKYKESQKKLRSLIERYHRVQPWSSEKDVWFARIYCNAYETRLCFFMRKRIEFTSTMRVLLEDFVKEAKMNEEDSEKLRTNLLQAEQKIDIRRKRRRSENLQLCECLHFQGACICC